MILQKEEKDEIKLFQWELIKRSNYFWTNISLLAGKEGEVALYHNKYNIIFIQILLYLHKINR